MIVYPGARVELNISQHSTLCEKGFFQGFYGCMSGIKAAVILENGQAKEVELHNLKFIKPNDSMYPQFSEKENKIIRDRIDPDFIGDVKMPLGDFDDKD